MITAIDSNILIDLLQDDPRFADASSAALRRSRNEGALVVCEVVWAETAAALGTPAEVRQNLDNAEIVFVAMTVGAAERAGTEWRQYRRRGGARTRLVADFLIGAHAMHQADRLLTRDRGFYRTYFPGLVVVDPLDL